MKYRLYPKRVLNHLISMPFIWVPVLPLILADIFVEIYHRICFPLYGLKYIERKKYIRLDRHKLKYLNFWEKIGCLYCGYANGWLAYTTKIAGDTEAYWCGIKHKKYQRFYPPAHHDNFPDYEDEEAWKNKYIPKK